MQPYFRKGVHPNRINALSRRVDQRTNHLMDRLNALEERVDRLDRENQELRAALKELL